MSTSTGLLDRGRQALAVGDWGRARDLFREDLAESETPEALEGLGQACWWLDDVVGLFEARERAYRLYRERNDAPGAARLALALADDAVTFRGEASVAAGWTERARRLLSTSERSREHALLALRDGFAAFAFSGDMSAAHARLSQAIQIARSFGWFDLEVYARALDGTAMTAAGDIAPGMRLLDEAAATAISGEMHDVELIANTCCSLIFACERSRDFPRAAEWCERIRDFSARHSMNPIVDVCRAHYGMVLIAAGDFSAAEAELLGAAARLTPRQGHLLDAVARLGELRRRQGRHEEAAGLFEQAAGAPEAQVWRAALELDLGHAAEAARRAERYLRSWPPAHRITRVEGLEVLARAHAGQANAARAWEAIAELETLADAIGTPLVRAAAAFSRADVELAVGRSQLAIAATEDAIDIFERNRLPYEAAWARLLRARALMKEPDVEQAQAEAAAALATFERLGAWHAATKAGELVRRPASPLSVRELEVLRLVADGLGDKEIARSLHLSPHTVHRHVGNILAKLGVPTRSAALARATRDRLL